MRCRPFESAASELVPEDGHPVAQLEELANKACELEAAGDHDAVVECRIKQLALHRLLVYLYDFPLAPLIRAEIALAEAYATGGYIKQAHEHLVRAHEISGGGIFDDLQCQRVQVDLELAEGATKFAEGQQDAAKRCLEQAAKQAREIYGDMDVRLARIHDMLGQLAQTKGDFDEAIGHYSASWEVRECIGGAEDELTIRVVLRMAEVEYLSGLVDDALGRQMKVVDNLQRLDKFPKVHVDASADLARWFEAQGRDAEALAVLQNAEKTVATHFQAEDAKAVDVKRDVALLHLKLGDHDTALQYLNDVDFYERRLHGSQSANVGRTLKALGTVHLVRQSYTEAEQCLVQALRIFESCSIFEVDRQQNHVIIKDIHVKLSSIAAAVASQ